MKRCAEVLYQYHALLLTGWKFELPSSAVRFITSLLETARHLKLILWNKWHGFLLFENNLFYFFIKKILYIKIYLSFKNVKKKKKLKSLYISAFTALREIIKYSDGPCYLSIISLKYFYLFKIIESVINLCLKKFSN